MRRRELAKARAKRRTAALGRALPWVVFGVLAASALIAAALAWRDATVPVPAPRPAGATGPVSVVGLIDSRLATGQPTGVAVSGDRVYVADARRSLVDVFTREGGHVATIGAGWLRTPVGVAVGPVDGRVYVTDRTRNVVAVFAASGERLRLLRKDGVDAPKGSAAPVWRPLAIAFAPDGTLYVSDTSEEQRVLVFSATGSYVTSIGAEIPLGRSGSALAFPNGMAVTRDVLYVADSNNGRILVMGRDGAYLRQIAVDGLPRGIATTRDGRLVLADASSAVIRAYDSAGVEIVSSGGWGVDPGRFSSPNGVALDEDGRIYVGDTGNGRVQVIRMPRVAAAGSSPRRERSWWALVAVVLAALDAVWVWYSRRLVRSRLCCKEGQAL